MKSYGFIQRKVIFLLISDINELVVRLSSGKVISIPEKDIYQIWKDDKELVFNSFLSLKKALIQKEKIKIKIPHSYLTPSIKTIERDVKFINCSEESILVSDKNGLKTRIDKSSLIEVNRKGLIIKYNSEDLTSLKKNLSRGDIIRVRVSQWLEERIVSYVKAPPTVDRDVIFLSSEKDFIVVQDNSGRKIKIGKGIRFGKKTGGRVSSLRYDKNDLGSVEKLLSPGDILRVKIPILKGYDIVSVKAISELDKEKRLDLIKSKTKKQLPKKVIKVTPEKKQDLTFPEDKVKMGHPKRYSPK